MTPDGGAAGRVVDILLCEHHYRASAKRLDELGISPVRLTPESTELQPMRA